MSTIIISGLKSNKLITQGYSSAAALGGDSWHYYYRPKTVKRNNREIFIQIKSLLEALKGE